MKPNFVAERSKVDSFHLFQLCIKSERKRFDSDFIQAKKYLVSVVLDIILALSLTEC